MIASLCYVNQSYNHPLLSEVDFTSVNIGKTIATLTWNHVYRLIHVALLYYCDFASFDLNPALGDKHKMYIESIHLWR